MYKEINFYDFVEAFKKMDRQDNFSEEGLVALYDYIEEMEDATGEQIELDVVAICCDFMEFDTKKELLEQYGYETIEEIEKRTIITKTVKDSYIIQAF